MKKLFLSSLIGLSFISASANADNWKFIFKNDFAQYYIKNDIKNIAGYKRAWFKVKVNKPAKLDGARKKVDSLIQLSEYDCANERDRMLHVNLYYTDRDFDSVDLEANNQAHWERIVPETASAAMYEAICTEQK